MNIEIHSMFRQLIPDNEPVVWLKPTCDYFQIDYQNQVQKIKNDPILMNSYGKNPNNSLFGDTYPRIYLTKKGFVRWSQIVNANTIREDLRERFIQFQEAIFDFMFQSMEQFDQAKVQYQRLNKLERLEKKIQSEIRRTKHGIDRYLVSHFGKQLEMDLEKSLSADNTQN